MNTKLFPFLTAIMITLAPEGRCVVVSGCRLTGSLQSQELAPGSGYYHNTNTYIRFAISDGGGATDRQHYRLRLAAGFQHLSRRR